MSDRELRDLTRRARAGDSRAGVALAYELRRLGMIPEETGLGLYSTTEIIHDSYDVEMMWRGRPFDVCIVPVTPSAIHIQIGGVGQEPVVEMSERWTATEEEPGFEPRLQRREFWHPSGRDPRPMFSYNIRFYACHPMRSPVFVSPGGKEYEVMASGPFVRNAEGRFVLPEPRRNHFRFGFASSVRRRPRNYQGILWQIRAVLSVQIRRMLNEWVAENPRALAAVAPAIDVSVLTRRMEHLEVLQRQAAVAATRVSTAALAAASALGL